MKWNTTPFTNIDDEVFVGRYNGVDFEVNPGEKVYLPTIVTEHIYEQLILKIDDKLEKNESIPDYTKILGEEIKTAEENKNMSFSEQVKFHQKKFKEWQDSKKREAILKKDKAIKIVEKNV